jgi:hypothetical protein
MKTKQPEGTPCYQIRIEGHLDDLRASDFCDMQVSLLPNGQTLLCGEIEDQSALFGLLIRIRDLGIQLLSLNRLCRDEDDCNQTTERNETK